MDPSPLVSILSHLKSQPLNTHPLNIHFLYSSRLPNGVEKSSQEASLEQILFLSRLRNIVRAQSQSKKLQISLSLFLTNLDSSQSESNKDPADLAVHSRRINEDDLRSSIAGTDGQLDPLKTVSYVCGPPRMTDEMVDRLKVILNDRDEQRIFYEKWW